MKCNKPTTYMLYVFVTRWLREGRSLGECYIISGGVCSTVMQRYMGRRGVKKGHFLFM